MSNPLIILRFLKQDLSNEYKTEVIEELRYCLATNRILAIDPAIYDIEYIPTNQGSWIIETKDGRVHITCDTCRHTCKPTIFDSLNYCPNCGTRMKNYDINEILKIEEN